MKKFLKKKLNIKKEFQAFSFLLLLIGFVCGNLFGINFYFIKWNFFSIFFVPFLLEVVNFVQKELKKNIAKNKQLKNCNLKLKLLFFDYLKRGFLLGIFVEAFKVGS